MPVTINDVARRAGVAKKTVSRVINNEPHVRDSVRARVEAAIAELGYVPNIAAQRLASNRSFTIALAIGAASRAYLAPTLYSTLDVAMASGYTLLVVQFDPQDPASLANIAGLARRRQADGLILTISCDDREDDITRLLPSGFPIVQLGGADPSSAIPSVSADDRDGAYHMTEYLIESGHRRIGYVSSDSTVPLRQRSRGFRAAMEDHGVPIDPGYVIVPDDFGFEGGVCAGRTLLESDPHPTAIFAANDAAAAGVLAAAAEYGLRVPEDLSVAGFDDFPLAEQTRPALTTVRLPIDQMGRVASEILVGLINGRPPQDSHVRLPLSLVIRQSTGPCPGA